MKEEKIFELSVSVVEFRAELNLTLFEEAEFFKRLGGGESDTRRK